MDDLIKQGANAFRAGNRDEARELLLTAVKQNPDSERAWGWLYNVTDNDKERIFCLNQMLRINPNNEKASRLLNSLISPQFPFENRQTHASQQRSQQVQIPTQPVQKQPVNKSSNTQSSRTLLVLIITAQCQTSY